MKIAHIVSTFPPYAGGMGNVCLHEVKGLANLGHEITVFVPGSESSQNQSMEGFNVKYIKPLFVYGNSAFIPQVIKKLKNFDIIHLHWPFIGGSEVVLFWKKFTHPKSKLIVQYHMDLIDTGWRGLVFKFYNFLFNYFFIKQANKILVSSFDYIEHSKIKKWLFKYRKKFIEFPFGVDINKFYPQPKNNKLLQKYNFNSDEKIILLVGGLDRAHYFKGVNVLLHALSSYKLQATSYKLLIVGEGDLKQSYKKLARDLKISNKVIFAGRISNQDLPQHYNLADIFTLPSTTSSEAFGLVFLEAMACAKPIIVSDLPGPRTLVKNNGLIVKVNDVDDLTQKLILLLKNKTLRQQFGQQGRNWIEKKYNWSKVVEKLDKIYHEVDNS